MNRPDSFEEDLRAVIERDAPTRAPEQLRARVRAVSQQATGSPQLPRRGLGASAVAVAIVVVLGSAIAIQSGVRFPSGAVGLAPPTSTATPQPSHELASGAMVAASPTGSGITDVPQPTTVHVIRWSPDGAHVLIAGDDLDVLDRRGAPTMTVPGVSTADWVGPGAVAAGSPALPDVGYGSVSIDDLDGGVARLPGTYALDLVGGPNELALVPASPDSPAGWGTFMVWRDGQLEGPYPGTPLVWSKDGARLIATVGAVALGPLLPGAPRVIEAAAGAPSGGHIRVWTFPGAVPGRAVSTMTVDPRYRPVFSPDGQTIAVPCGLSAASADCATTVIDTVTMQARVAGQQPPGLGLSWLPSGELLLASPAYPQPGPLQAWSPRGTRPTALTGAWGRAGATGAVGLETTAMGEAGATRVVAATGELLASMPAAIDLDWSPDGTCLLVRVDPQAPLLLYCQQR